MSVVVVHHDREPHYRVHVVRYRQATGGPERDQLGGPLYSAGTFCLLLVLHILALELMPLYAGFQ